MLSCTGSLLLYTGFSLVAESGVYSSGGVWACPCGGFSCCGTGSRGTGFSGSSVRAWLTCSMWNLPRPGTEPIPPALAGRLVTTEHRKVPNNIFFKRHNYILQFSCSVMSDSLRPHESQHARPPCASPTPRVHPNSCASSRWCHPVISSSAVPFSSCPQSLSYSVKIIQWYSYHTRQIKVY